MKKSKQNLKKRGAGITRSTTIEEISPNGAEDAKKIWDASPPNDGTIIFRNGVFSTPNKKLAKSLLNHPCCKK